ncbi:MAG: twin-arginine translocase TatA/TatE family subunit [Myxococcales bacterium]|nr:twin-arginine translocase TatA/TatE family subunit [Myxococcales bacterium]MCB9521759.1 twin-arginine translocase TatA/TatE family subunit [Myxococcales bacterium]
MLPFGIGFSEIVLIGIVLLLVVGPHKLPDLAKTLGKGLRVVRKASTELRNAMDFDEVRDVKRELYRPLTDWRDAEPEDVVAEPVKPGRTPQVRSTEIEDAELEAPSAPAADVPHGELAGANAAPAAGAEDDEDADDPPYTGPLAQHDPLYHKLKAELERANADYQPTAGDADGAPPQPGKPEGTDGNA